MKGKKLIIYSCFSALIILLNFVIYYGFSDVSKTAIQNISFAFIIIAQIILFGMIYLVTREQINTFIRAGVASASAIYLTTVLTLNILMNTAVNTVRALITTNVIALLIYVAIILIIYLFKKEK